MVQVRVALVAVTAQGLTTAELDLTAIILRLVNVTLSTSRWLPSLIELGASPLSRYILVYGYFYRTSK